MACDSLEIPETPPWKLYPPAVDVSLAYFEKRQVSPDEFRLRSLELIASYPDHMKTYTDGSKADADVGCAFVQGPVTRPFALPGHASVFTSELIAINSHKALHFIEVDGDDQHLVLSDSLSSLMALQDLDSSHFIVQNILTLLTTLSRSGKQVVFCWIPSHVGISGNGAADAAARRATHASGTLTMTVPANDLCAVVSAFMLKQWQAHWDVHAANKLREIRPRLGPWASSCRRVRREEVTLCLLRIGHTYATHRYLLCGEDQPRCPRCGDRYTVRHVLIDCAHLALERMRHFGSGSLRPALCGMFGDDSSSVHDGYIFSYLDDVQFHATY
ncbi:uncharacterized protein LOC119106275 [Pollicipes pollicipes]|uniref:uncharacterized protein LOC119106275 n=1 Tax=Pollicipes pollicipes TaxID=41117 RepID=UPI00188558EE|nr:uncharacterized protein LOC119106275 [Pollicipes pollicipes]